MEPLSEPPAEQPQQEVKPAKERSPRRTDLKRCRFSPADSDLMTSSDLARLFGVNSRTIFTWISTGVLPQPIRISARMIRWPRRQIEDFLKQHTPAEEQEVQEESEQEGAGVGPEGEPEPVEEGLVLAEAG
jgi:predicted DNA-binding transcriptional regulator AlpA